MQASIDAKQALIAKHAVTLKPLFYDCSKLPPGAYQEMDRLLECMGVEDLSSMGNDKATKLKFEHEFKRRDIVSDTDMGIMPHLCVPKEFESLVSNPQQFERRVFVIKPKSGRDILQIISRDPQCLLWHNDQCIFLGEGTFNIPRMMILGEQLAIEHSTNLIDLVTREYMLLRINYYALESKLRMIIPSWINLKINKRNYVTAHQCITGNYVDPETLEYKPRCIVIEGDFHYPTVKSEYKSLKVISHQVQKLLNDTNRDNFMKYSRHAPGMIHLSFPPFTYVSVHNNCITEFTEYIRELLGDVKVEIPKKFDQDTVNISEEEKERQIIVSTERRLANAQNDIETLVSAGIISYMEPI